jgi:L-lactate permease
MNLSQLPQLGKVAGVPGIALGVVALLSGGVLETTGVLPEAWRGPVSVAIVVGAVLMGVLALIAWSRGTRASGDFSAATNSDKTKGKTGGSQRASTKGANSPATNKRE